MGRSTLLAMEAAQRCRDSLLKLKDETYWDDGILDHALTMCDDIETYCDCWSPTRLHRWLGFILGVLAARNVMTPGEQSALIRELLVAYPERSDSDLRYHNDPRHPFQLDLGGEG